MTRRYCCEECGEPLQPDEIAESLTALGALLGDDCLGQADEAHYSPVQRR